MASDLASGGSSSDPASDNAAAFRNLTLARPGTVVGAPARTVFGQVMGLVAVTIGFTALGAYLGRNLTGGTGLLFFIAGFACIFGLQFATARGREQLAVGLLFGLGLALGLAVAPVIHVSPRPTPPLYGRQRVPPRRPSPAWEPSATRRATTFRAGLDSCSGRCSL